MTLPFMAHQRILVDVAATLTSTRLDFTGEPADAVGAVTVTITRGDGTALVTGAATSHPSLGVYEVALTAIENDRLDLLTAVWSEAGGATWQTTHEVVGGVWFTVTQARTIDKNLTDSTIYPTARIIEVRSEVEGLLEHELRRAYVPTYGRAVVQGTGRHELVAPHPQLRRVRSVGVYTAGDQYSAFDTDEVAALLLRPGGVIHRPAGVWPLGTQVVVEYEHGFDTPPPDLRKAAIRLMRHSLNADKSGIPDRAESFVNDAGGRFVISTPGLRGAITGIPDVDAAIIRHRFHRYGMA